MSENQGYPLANGTNSGQQPTATQYSGATQYPAPYATQPAGQNPVQYPGQPGSQQLAQYPGQNQQQYPGQYQSQYQSQYPGNYAGQYPAQYQAPRQDDGLAIASLACGIGGVCVVPILASIAGIITGHMAMGKVKRGESPSRGLALAGLITSYVGLGFWVAIIAIQVATLLAFLGVMSQLPTQA